MNVLWVYMAVLVKNFWGEKIICYLLFVWYGMYIFLYDKTLKQTTFTQATPSLNTYFDMVMKNLYISNIKNGPWSKYVV